jgi:hypothetical protein
MDVVMKSQDRSQGERVKMDHWALRYPTNTEDVGRVCYGGFSFLAGLASVWVYMV